MRLLDALDGCVDYVNYAIDLLSVREGESLQTNLKVSTDFLDALLRRCRRCGVRLVGTSVHLAIRRRRVGLIHTIPLRGDFFLYNILEMEDVAGSLSVGQTDGFRVSGIVLVLALLLGSVELLSDSFIKLLESLSDTEHCVCCDFFLRV